MNIPSDKPEAANFVTFDIETAPQDEATLLALMPPFDPAEVKLGNIKDADKIAAKVADAEVKHKARWLSEAALSPVTGKVACITVSARTAAGIDIGTVVNFADDTEAEAREIYRFWEMIEQAFQGTYTYFVGHNILDFDLPFLINRSRILNIPLPRHLYSIKGGRVYFSDHFVDTRLVWLLGRKAGDNPSSLDFVAKALKVGAKNGSGADFAQLMKTDREAAKAYAANDVHLTTKVAQRLGIIG
jgi:hypothetical protein